MAVDGIYFFARFAVSLIKNASCGFMMKVRNGGFVCKLHTLHVVSVKSPESNFYFFDSRQLSLFMRTLNLLLSSAPNSALRGKDKARLKAQRDCALPWHK